MAGNGGYHLHVYDSEKCSFTNYIWSRWKPTLEKKRGREIRDQRFLQFFSISLKYYTCLHKCSTLKYNNFPSPDFRGRRISLTLNENHWELKYVPSVHDSLPKSNARVRVYPNHFYAKYCSQTNTIILIIMTNGLLKSLFLTRFENINKYVWPRRGSEHTSTILKATEAPQSRRWI